MRTELDLQAPEIQAEYGPLVRLYFATDEATINLMAERSGDFGPTEEYFWISKSELETFQFFQSLGEATQEAQNKNQPLIYEALIQLSQLIKALNSRGTVEMSLMVREILAFS